MTAEGTAFEEVLKSLLNDKNWRRQRRGNWDFFILHLCSYPLVPLADSPRDNYPGGETNMAS